MPEIDHATAGVVNWKLCQHGFFGDLLFARYTHISLFVFFSQWIFFSFWTVHQTLNRWIWYEAKSNLQTIALNVGSHRTFANNFFAQFVDFDGDIVELMTYWTIFSQLIKRLPATNGYRKKFSNGLEISFFFYSHEKIGCNWTCW